jgi:EAL domain-containing protein (putative c-di-GMP-specific phosphodiesterase class I)
VAAASRLRQTLLAPVEVDGLRLEVGASVGVALAPGHAQDAATLLRRADLAMYAAKRSGQGVALFSDDLDHDNADRVALTIELRDALEHAQLVLHYQPKVDVDTRSAIGVEALVRWQHPRRGLLGPDHFIPHAEQAGLIEPLTRWVLLTARKQQAAWRALGLDLTLAVNLSMRNFQDPHLVETVRDVLAEGQHVHGDLVLELTESTLMADPERARRMLAELRALGVKIAVDDFGTGYSSLAYLKRLPLDELKIDRCFVRDLGADERDRALVKATIDLAHTLGLTVVAEGVEDAASLQTLRRLGCDLVQGYYMSRPLPADELGHWAAAWTGLQRPWTVLPDAA